MRYHVLAADYDGTLAHEGEIDEPTLAALRKLRESGRKLVMVTGRELDELLGHLGESQELFDRIVAENGALVYEPATKAVKLLAQPPPREFAAELERRGCERVAAGRVIVATWEPHQVTALDVIREQGLELQVVFNKGAVMVLPSGVNKATGLLHALDELGQSPRNTVAVGDAENDHALLALSECGVAVANALPALKDKADVLTRGARGEGVQELIGGLLKDDLRAAAPLLRRRSILLGAPVASERTPASSVAEGRRGEVASERTLASSVAEGRRGQIDPELDPITLDPYATNMMVCGTSGGGKSTLTTGLIERIVEGGYQFVIVDPEGDFSEHEHAVVLGGPQRTPLMSEILDVLKDPSKSVVVNLLGVALEHRPEFAVELFTALAKVRASSGRPHWLIVDEAHHLMPAEREAASVVVGVRPHGTIYLTVHPGSVDERIVRSINVVLAVGANPDRTIGELCADVGIEAPPAAFTEAERLPVGDVLYWRVGAPEAIVVRTAPPTAERKRHSRKYSEGNLGRDRSFYFKGPDGKLNLKAHNLQLFLHLADGVDDATWTYHLERNDYSKWLRIEVKDPGLADEVEAIEEDDALPPADSRAAMRAAIEAKYTLPADKPSGVIDPEEEKQRKGKKPA